jgi:hypothetical protein
VHWTTLTRPRKPGPGGRLLHIEGDVEGAARPVLALREGGETLFEGPVPVVNGRVNWNLVFDCRGGAGDLYTLVRLADGEGTLRLSELYWSPFSKAMLKGSGIEPPSGCFEAPDAL